ncbi:hypothetical protein LguiA_002814 [Lonicera macranthoides]
MGAVPLSMGWVFLGFSLAIVLLVGSASSARFDQLFQPTWAMDHFAYEGDTLKMKLDNYSGAGFQSKSKYMFGKVNIQIKLVEGDSAGTVTALFLVDQTPIRVHTNMEHKGVPFPRDQAMGVYSSIRNADDWATQGGRVKTDWSHAPFIASYRGFEIDGCECPVKVASVDNARRCTSGNGNGKRFWWDEPTLSELNVHQSHQLTWVRAHHMIYDYCTDTARFPSVPVECEHHGGRRIIRRRGRRIRRRIHRHSHRHHHHH